MYIYQLTGSKWFMDELIKRGYDGVLAWESGMKTFGFIDSNQFKSISNRNPSKSDNVNENILKESVDSFIVDACASWLKKRAFADYIPQRAFILPDGSFIDTVKYGGIRHSNHDVLDDDL